MSLYKYSAYHRAAAVLSVYDNENLKPFGEPTEGDDIYTLLADSTIARSESGHESWKLVSDVRREILEQLGDRETMQRALEANPKRQKDLLQQIFEAYIQDKAKPLQEQEISELAASLQVSEWLEGILPGIPPKAEIRNQYEKIALLQPFDNLAGGHFGGRVQELTDLRNYVEVLPPGSPKEALRRWVTRDFLRIEENPPLNICGPGGIGKSTLVARFIWEHATLPDAQKFPWIYVDFDRPRFRPENPITILLEGVRQLGVQYPDVKEECNRIHQRWLKKLSRTPDGSLTKRSGEESIQTTYSEPKDWHVYVRDFANLVMSLKVEGSPLLLVLDTFEVVQYHGESVVENIFDFLEILQSFVPRLRSVISGRAPIANTSLIGKQIKLAGFDQEAAIEFLKAREVPEKIAPQIATYIGGNPLSLALAAKLLIMHKQQEQEFVNLASLKELREEEIQGVLYERILSHIQDDNVRKLAFPGLALRRITPDIIRKVLAKPCGIKLESDQDADILFERMKQHIWLVQVEGDALVHRSDLRIVMNRLLREEKHDVAWQIDEAARDYYLTQDNPTAKAEEIYHRLMLREEYQKLDAAWGKGDKIDLDNLYGVEDDLAVRERVWLKKQLGLPLSAEERNEADLEGWERDAVMRVLEFLKRGQAQKTLGVLRERKDRMPGSPLYELEVQALVLLEDWESARKSIAKGLDAARKSGSLLLGFGLQLQRAHMEFQLGDLTQAREAIDEAASLIENRENPTRQIEVALDSLHLIQLQESAQAEEILDLEVDINRWFGRMQDKDVIQHPILMGRLAHQLKSKYPEMIWRIIRLTGLESGLKAPLREFGRALSDWDQKLSKTARRSPGLLARQLSIPEKGSLAETWSIYVEEAKPEALRQLVMDFLDLYQAIPEPVVSAVAEILAGRARHLTWLNRNKKHDAKRSRVDDHQAAVTREIRLTNQQIQQLASALLNSFSPDELRLLVDERLDRSLGAIAPSSKSDHEFVIRLIDYTQRSSITHQLLNAARESRPSSSALFELATELGLTSVSLDQEITSQKLIEEGSFLNIEQWQGQLGRLENQICRVEIEAETNRFGTGFLVAPNLVLTSYHLVRGVKAEEIRIHFTDGALFQLTSDGLVSYSGYLESELNSGQKPIASTGDELDFALLKIDGSPGTDLIGGERADSAAATRGWVEISPQEINIEPGDPVLILKYQEAKDATQLSIQSDGFIGYNENKTRFYHKVDTGRGSTGAPCFSINLELIGIHRALITDQSLLASVAGWISSLLPHGSNVDLKEAVPIKAILDYLESQDIFLHSSDSFQSRELGVGSALYRDGYAEDISMREYENALAKSRRSGDKFSEAVSCLNLGTHYYRVGQYDKAVNFLFEGQQIAQTLGEKKLGGSFLIRLGIVHRELGQLDRAIDFFQRANNLAREIDDGEGLVESLNNLGLAYHNKADFQSAISYYQEAIAAARNVRDEAYILKNLALAYQDIGEISKAIDYYNRSTHIATQNNDLEIVVANHNDLGLAYYNQGQMDQALSHFEKAIAESSKTGNFYREADINGNIGLVYLARHEENRAIQYFNRAIQISEQIHDLQSLGIWLGQLGQAYFQLNQPSEAHRLLERALGLTKRVGDREGEAEILNIMGRSNIQTGNVLKAFEDFKAALFIFREIGHRVGSGESLGNFGLAYEQLGLIEPAIHYLREAVDLLGDTRSSVLTLYQKRLSTLLDNSNRSWHNIFFVTEPVLPGESPILEVSAMEKSLIKNINETNESIDFSLFEFDLERVVDPLISAHQRGVRVRIVADDEFGLEADSNPGRGQLSRLANSGIGIVEDNRSGLMHANYIVFDNQHVWLGTSSPTSTAYTRHYSHTMLVKSSELARYFTVDFETKFKMQDFMEAEKVHRLLIEKTDVEVFLINTRSTKLENRLLDLIGETKKSINFMLFSFTLDSVGKKIVEQIQKGIKVTGIFEQRGANTQNSEFPKILNAGGELYFHNRPGIMHEKTLVIDDRIVIILSGNITKSSLQKNNEYVVIFHSKEIAQQFLKYFELLKIQGNKAKEDFFLTNAQRK